MTYDVPIWVDFDGTCVEHDYPDIGPDVPGAVETLRDLTEIESDVARIQLIIFTMRSGDTLQAAVDWYRRNQIPLYGVNTHPLQSAWTSSPKAYAEKQIDDAGLGCPLREGIYNPGRPMVDWVKTRKLLGRWLRGTYGIDFK